MSDDDKLLELLAEVFRSDKATITDSLAYNSGPTWDSLAQMELIAAIEATYDIELSAEEILEINTVGKLRKLLKRRVQGIQLS